MSVYQERINAMVEMLPDSEQELAFEFVKRLVLAWDPDFTKVTPNEREQIKHAEESGYIPEDEIDWNHLEDYLE